MSNNIRLKGFVHDVEDKEIPNRGGNGNSSYVFEVVLKTKFRGREEGGVTLFNKVAFWSPLRDKAMQSISKDSYISIEGKITYANIYTKKDGNPGFNVNIKAYDFDLLERPNQSKGDYNNQQDYNGQRGYGSQQNSNSQQGAGGYGQSQRSDQYKKVQSDWGDSGMGGKAQGGNDPIPF